MSKTTTEEPQMAATYYVRKSANPRATRPWQVRRQMPDQTFRVMDYCLARDDANAMADLRNACDETGAEQPTRYGAASDR